MKTKDGPGVWLRASSEFSKCMWLCFADASCDVHNLLTVAQMRRFAAMLTRAADKIEGKAKLLSPFVLPNKK